jgi:hypothetical protein
MLFCYSSPTSHTRLLHSINFDHLSAVRERALMSRARRLSLGNAPPTALFLESAICYLLSEIHLILKFEI